MKQLKSFSCYSSLLIWGQTRLISTVAIVMVRLIKNLIITLNSTVWLDKISVWTENKKDSFFSHLNYNFWLKLLRYCCQLDTSVIGIQCILIWASRVRASFTIHGQRCMHPSRWPCSLQRAYFVFPASRFAASWSRFC